MFQAALFMLVINLYGPAQAPKKGETDDRQWSASTGDVGLAVSLPRRVPAGNPLFITIRLTNNGTAPIEVESRVKYANAVIRIRDSQGRDVPRTQYGKTWSRARLFASVSRSTLRTSERAEDRLNLCLMFDLTMPGAYTMDVTRSFILNPQDRRVSTVSVTEIRFEVVGAD